jgi:TubC N-terminal docking domain
MTATAFIEELSRLGVRLHAEGNRLRYRGPAEVLTSELRERLSAHKPELLRVLTATNESREAEGYGPGWPSPENAGRPVEDRRNEALELCGELTNMYNERASAFEFAGLSRVEAERLAMLEVQATDAYWRWYALG